jgi:hypothetical protein
MVVGLHVLDKAVLRAPLLEQVIDPIEVDSAHVSLVSTVVAKNLKFPVSGIRSAFVDVRECESDVYICERHGVMECESWEQ